MLNVSLKTCSLDSRRVCGFRKATLYEGTLIKDCLAWCCHVVENHDQSRENRLMAIIMMTVNIEYIGQSPIFWGELSISSSWFIWRLFSLQRFQKTYEAEEAETEMEKKQLALLHEQRVQAELNDKRSQALDNYIDAIEDDDAEVSHFKSTRRRRHFLNLSSFI